LSIISDLWFRVQGKGFERLGFKVLSYGLRNLHIKCIVQDVFAATVQDVFAAMVQDIFAAIVQDVFAAMVQDVFAAMVQGVFAAMVQGVFAAMVQGVLAAMVQGVFAAPAQGHRTRDRRSPRRPSTLVTKPVNACKADL